MANSRIYHRSGSPIAWYDPKQGPRKTFPGDTGILADLAGTHAAGILTTGCTFASRGILAFDGTTGGGVTLPDLGLFPLDGSTHSGVVFSVIQTLSQTATGLKESFSLGSNGKSVELVADLPSAGDYSYFDGGGARVTAVGVFTGAASVRAAFVSDGSNASIYINGVLAATNPWSVAVAASGNPAYWIGYSGPQSGIFSWVGTIGDTQVYDRALTAGEIAEDYARPRWRLKPPSRTKLYAALPPPPVTGTGAATLAHITANGNGVGIVSGSGSATLRAVTASGSGVISGGSGSVILGRITASGSGALAVSGSGAATLKMITARGGVSPPNYTFFRSTGRAV